MGAISANIGVMGFVHLLALGCTVAAVVPRYGVLHTNENAYTTVLPITAGALAFTAMFFQTPC